MSDSKDIQAREPTAEELLLVDLLYGELDDDDARAARDSLSDGERAAELAAYEDLRSLFRELPDEDPPPAVSARLLHAAAEAAPKKSGAGSAAAAAAAGGGLLDRLLGFFRPLYANPALAAATMFVLVAGVAGALYLTGNFETAEPTTESTATPPAAEPPAEQPGTGEAVPRTDLPVGGSFELDLADEAGGEAEPTDEPARDRSSSAKGKPRPAATAEDGYLDKNADPPPPPPEPKRRSKTKATKKDLGKSSGSRSTGSATGGVQGTVGDSPLIDAEEVANEPAPDDDADGADRKLEEKKPEPEPAQQTRQIRVEDLHARAVQAARDGECEAVRSLGDRIRGANPTYYKNVYSRDKRLASCLSSPTKK